MSYTFSVEATQPPRYEDALAATACNLETGNDDDDDFRGPWQEGHIVPVWQHGVTTRAIELAWEEGIFSARILAIACAEDYNIALDIICAVAEKEQTEVEPEDGEPFAPRNREAHFGANWIDSRVDSMVSAVLAQARQTRSKMSVLPGPPRDFHIGPRVLAAIDTRSSGTERDALFEKMRAVLYPDDERYYTASIMAVTLDDDSEITLSAFGPGLGYLLPDVHLIALVAEPEVFLPREALLELLSERQFAWLDDDWLRVEPVDDADWDAFVERARPLGQELGGDAGDDDLGETDADWNDNDEDTDDSHDEDTGDEGTEDGARSGPTPKRQPPDSLTSDSEQSGSPIVLYIAIALFITLIAYFAAC